MALTDAKVRAMKGKAAPYKVSDSEGLYLLVPPNGSLIGRSLSEGTITPTKAGKVLGVKPRSVAPLLSGSTAPWAA